ncbi:alpha/beta fold hydrolase [candidate division KSB1 bacterium]
MKRFNLILFAMLSITVFIFSGCAEKIKNTAVSYDGVKIRFEVKGKGEPAIVFVHGFASEKADWINQTDHFSKKFKVAALDLAGFGESGTDRGNWTMGACGEDVVSVIKYLDLKKVVLVGQSMGTAVILEAAKRIPERIVGIVPVDMLQNVELKRTPEEIEQFEERVWNNLNNPDAERLRAAFKREVKPEVIQTLIDYYNSSPKIGWRETGKSFFAWLSNDLINVLLEVRAPIYCINSDRQVTQIEIARKYVESFNVKVIEKTGHPVMLDAPGDFNSALEEIIMSF